MLISTHSNEWTIIFLIYIEINKNENQSKLEKELDELIELLTKIELKEGYGILLLKTVLIKEKNGDDIKLHETTQLLKVVKGAQKNQNLFHPLYYEQTNSFMQTAGAIGSILKKIDLDDFEHEYITSAPHYLIITWGHGSSFGIFKNTSISDPQSFTILSNGDLAVALENGFGQKKIDVLLMYNCIMMNIHTSNALANNVHYIVAPQTMIEGPGYDYEHIITGLYNKNRSPQSLARLSVETMTHPSRSSQMYKIEKWGIFALRLSRIDAILESLSAITLFVNENFKINKHLLSIAIKSRSSCYEFDRGLGYYQVDYMHWLENLLLFIETDSTIGKRFTQTFKIMKAQIEHSLNEAIEMSKQGSFVYGNNTGSPMDKQLSGLVIFFPKRNVTSESMYSCFVKEGSTYECPFLKKNLHWLTFIDLLTK